MQAAQILIVIITVVSNLVLGYIAYKKNPHSATNKLLASLTLIISAWSVANYFSLNSPNEHITLFWIRAVMFITAPLAPVIYLFLYTFPSEKLPLERWKSVMILISIFIVMVLAFSPFMFSSVSISNGVLPTPGLGVIPYGLLTVGFLLAGFWNIYSKYKKSEGIVRLQLKYIVLGAVLTFSLQALTNYLLVVLFDFSSLVVFGPMFSMILIGSMTYAIVKHELLDIRLLTTQIFTLVIVIILFAKLFTIQSFSELTIDLFVFITVAVFGVLLVRSVSREVKQREQLEALTKKLKELDKQKDEFISMAAHELRAPMTAIKGYVTMVMEGDTGEIPEKARGFLADANNINERLIRLVNNMLNVSRIEEGRLVFQEEEENLSRPVRSVFSQFAPEAERKGLKYDLEIPTKLKDKVRVDPDRIQEVIGNLLSNAVKYTEHGSVTVKMLQPDDKTVRLEVVDTGTGISEVEQKRLFKKFERAESNVGKTTGTGLGLYISKLLVEKFGGKIGLNSKPGEGSTFWFELPLVDTSENSTS